MGVFLEIHLATGGIWKGSYGTFDWLEEVTGCFQPSVCSVVTFRSEAHGGAV